MDTSGSTQQHPVYGVSGLSSWSKTLGEISGPVCVFLFVLLDCIIFYLNPQKSSFWDIDSSLFLRYANDPDFFQYTSPAIARAIEASPSITREIFSIFHAYGLTYESNYMALYIGSVFVATMCVYFSAYLILRSFGAGSLVSALLVIVMLNSWYVIDYSRLHPLKNVMKHGGFSMVANSVFLLAIGLHIYGRTRVGLCLAAAVSLIHPVIGLLAAGFILGSSIAFESYRNQKLSFNSDAKLALGLVCAIIAFVLMRTNTAISADFDKELYFKYIYFRSSNPMPLRDSCVALLAHLFIFGSTLFLCASLGEKHQRQKIIIGALCSLWLLGLAAQIVFGEILESVTLVRLVLHRSSPMLFFLFGATLTFLLWRNIQEHRKYAGFLLMVVAVLLFMAGRSVIQEFSVFDYKEANIITWAGLVTALCLHESRSAYSKNYMRFFIGCGAVMLLVLLFGVRAKLKNILDDSAILPLTMLVVSVCIIAAFTARRSMKARVLFSDGRMMGALAVIILTITGFKLHAHMQLSGQEKETLNHVYKKYDLVRLLERNTDKLDVIYTQPGMDINGVRKAYLDWVHSWYNLYSLTETDRIALKLSTLGIDIRNDRLAYSRCGGGYWLFRFRCHRILGRVDQRLRDFDWRTNWHALKNVEPNLNFALISVSAVRPDDNVVDKLGKYALIAR